jgi:hypothetical protein
MTHSTDIMADDARIKLPAGDRLYRRTQAWRFPFGISLAMLGLWAIGAALGAAFLPLGGGKWHHGPILHGVTGNGATVHGATLADHLLAWDGLWYFDIAKRGYVWNPILGVLPKHFENPAFYPLYPLIERAVMDITGSSAPWIILLPGIIFGVASVFAFHKLAMRVIPGKRAQWATALFAFWPASVYCMMGYPTGLINFFVVAALGAYLEGRFWRAALWCGIGAAAAPTVQFAAVGLCLDQGLLWLARRGPLRDIPRLIGFGILSISGLIVFILYQAVTLHDPFVFLKAQDAWGIPPPVRQRLVRLIDPLWYWRNVQRALWAIESLYKRWNSPGETIQAICGTLESSEQWLLNAFSLVLAAAGVLAAFRYIRARALPLAALAGLVGYLWFITTTKQNITSAPRLIYPALVLFMGLAVLAVRSRLAIAGLTGIFALLTVLNAAFAIANYFLI